MIELRDLKHDYGSHLALKGLNLKIEDGEIFGLIGHNGAGKSTTIKAIVSILDATSGDILIDGKNLKENREEIKRKIGYVPDSPDMFLKLQADEYWKFMGNVYGMEPKDREERLSVLCETFDMSENRLKSIEEFSHGMRQKTFLIGALLPSPELWILDEPMTGLDPQSAFNLKELMRKHSDENKTVLFSTHVLEVAEKLCDRIGILKKGELIFVGTIEELKSTREGSSLEEIYLDMVSEENQEQANLSEKVK